MGHRDMGHRDMGHRDMGAVTMGLRDMGTVGANLVFARRLLLSPRHHNHGRCV